MDKVFDVATRVSSPLMLAGFIAAVFFFLLRQVIKKDIFPSISKPQTARMLTLIINRVFVLAFASMIFGFAGFVISIIESDPSPSDKSVLSDSISVPLIKDTDFDGLVVLLPGIIGDVNSGAARLGEAIQNSYTQLEQHLDYQVWPWHSIKIDGDMSAIGASEANRLRAVGLAYELRDWRTRNPGKRIYLVASSGGGWVTLLASEAVDSDGRLVLASGFFERIVLLSTVIMPNTDLSGLIDRAKHGVFNYSSENDSLLATLGLTEAAGRKGFPEHANVLQLRHKPEHRNSPYLNDGEHLSCYADGFASHFLIGLFHLDPTHYPSAWE